MSKPLVSKRKSEMMGNGVFLIGLGIVLYTNTLWPWILIVIWASLSARQMLTGRNYDFVLTTAILVSLFVVNYFNLDFSVLMPVLFVLGGVYIIFREYFYSDDTNGEDKSKELRDDLDDGKEAT